MLNSVKVNQYNKKYTTDFFKTLLPFLGILFITKGLYIYTETFLDVNIFENYLNSVIALLLLNTIPFFQKISKYDKIINFKKNYNNYTIFFKNINIFPLFLMVFSTIILFIIMILKIKGNLNLNYDDLILYFFKYENILNQNYLKILKNINISKNDNILFCSEFRYDLFFTLENKQNQKKNIDSFFNYFLTNFSIPVSLLYVKNSLFKFLEFYLADLPFIWDITIVKNGYAYYGNRYTNGLKNFNQFNIELVSYLDSTNSKWLRSIEFDIIATIQKNIFLDGISLWLFWLVLIISYVVSFTSSKKKIINNNYIFKRFYIYNNLINIIIILMIVCFLVKDIFIFFIAFESILLPLFMYIIFQGSRLNKIFAVKYLVIYTIVGSIFLWYSISYIVEILGVSNFDYVKWVILNSLSSGTRKILFLSLFIGFAFKIPMVPFHHWLVIAHVEAPTNGSIILAALLLKVGGYGMYRFVYNIFPLEVFQFSNEIIALSVFSFSYATILAVRQVDIKRYIAYTSIAHMNFSLIGLFSCTEIGMLGYFHMMISHGIISTAMFYLIGHLYSIINFRDTIRVSGIAYKFPKFSFFFFIFSIANMGIPLFSGFPGEFFIFTSLVISNEFYACLVFLGFMFSGVYNFLQINKILFSGYITSISLKKNEDLDNISILILTILMFWSVVFGIFPDIIIKNVEIELFC